MKALPLFYKLQKFAYSARPIIIKNAATNWPAGTHLTFQYLKDLYYKYPHQLMSFEDDCQFLPFKSSFDSLSEFFKMPDEQVASGKPTWYVGFSNCQSNILTELRQLYPRPHFLPEDAEIPNTDYIFMGYDEGAVMHVCFAIASAFALILNMKKSLLSFFLSVGLYTQTDVAGSVKRQQNLACKPNARM